MAGLSLQFTICSTGNCQSFDFTETTGVYDPTVNTGGWGAPNVNIATALTATLEIKQPDNSIVTIGTSILYPLFPSDANDTITISNILMGLSSDATLQQGKYTMTYTVTGDDGTPWVYSTTSIVMIYCTAQCCVLTMAGNVRVSSDCDCKNKTLSAFNESFAYLEALKAAMECGKSNKAQSILDHLNEVCSGSGCGCS